MEYRQLGESGVQVSVIGVGTWPMSGAFWGPADDEESVRTIHRALALGVNLFDTAEGYGGGHSEAVLGQALVGRRHEAVIASKVSPTHLEPAQIRAAFANSCQRMQTDYIDVYFIHWPNSDLPIGPVMAELEAMRREGKIKAIGVSNFTSVEMDEARQHGRIDVLQPPYNLFWRFIESDQLPYCQEHGIGVMTYSSLAQGLLTGRLTRDTQFGPGDERPRTVLFQPENYARCLDAVDQMRPIAARCGKSLSQLGISWVIGRPGVTTALLGARTVAEIEENAGGVGLALSPTEAATLDASGRAVYESLPQYLDMFRQWERNEVQQRRYARLGRLPAS